MTTEREDWGGPVENKSLMPIDEAPVTMKTLETMAAQGLLPERYMNQPQQAAIAILHGKEIGLHPLTAINDLYLVGGSVGMLARTMSALIHQAGHVLTVKYTETKVTLECKRWHPQSKQLIDVGIVEFGKKDADKAGLSGKPVYKKYPQSAWANRAISKAARLLYADVFTGIGYVPEEIELSDGMDPDELVPLEAAEVAEAMEGEIVDSGTEEEGDDE